jgi:hypothetical protein
MSAPDPLPLFRSEFEVRLLALLLLQPDRAWTLPEIAERLEAPVSSAHRELRRAEGAGIVDRDSGSRPHTFRAAERSPLYKPLADLLELTLGVERELTPGPDEIPEVEPARGPLADLISRVPHQGICQRVRGGISPRRMISGALRTARSLSPLG